MQNFNEKIISAITRQESKKKILISTLMKMLSICKESAYRRIRNQIPFSMEEVVILANHYNLSIDSLFDIKLNKGFDIEGSLDIVPNSSEPFVRLLREDIGFMQKLQTSSHLKITAILNQVPFRLLPYQSLFRLDYCHELYSTGEISLMAKYSDIEISPQLNSLRERAVECFSRVNNITCIIDGTIYPNIINKVKYYYRMGFISGEDLKIIRLELLELLNKYESLLRTGANGAGSNYNFYYSPFTNESNIIFIEYDGNTVFQDWVYPKCPIVITNNPLINDFQKGWIDSKIRNSIPITKSADAQQVEMLRAAYRQIEGLM